MRVSKTTFFLEPKQKRLVLLTLLTISRVLCRRWGVTIVTTVARRYIGRTDKFHLHRLFVPNETVLSIKTNHGLLSLSTNNRNSQ